LHRSRLVIEEQIKVPQPRVKTDRDVIAVDGIGRGGELKPVLVAERMDGSNVRGPITSRNSNAVPAVSLASA
jgi:hypothetical protein